MKKLVIGILFGLAGAGFYTGDLIGQELERIKLNAPNLKRGLPFMEALSVKASVREWSDAELKPEDLSDLLWAANGLNRPKEKKTTASSAMNAHEVDIFVFIQQGVYLYDFYNHELVPVLPGDFRAQVVPPRSGVVNPSQPPVEIILIGDSARFTRGSKDMQYEWCAIDAGIISQNISLFCAATGLKTCPRASMDREKIRSLLKLKETQYVLLDHPVGYPIPAAEK